jgi:hypothetical protein
MKNINELPRVFADFQNTDGKGRVRLNTIGTMEDLSQLGLILRDGLEILLYCLELETEGVVVHSEEENIWVSKVNWSDVRPRISE